MSANSDQIQESRRKIALIASCLGWGSGCEAAERGPIELLNAGLAEKLNAMVTIVQAEPSMQGRCLPQTEIEEAIATHVVKVADAVALAIEGGYFPVVIGGDHTSAIGFHAGLAMKYGQAGIVWIDTHPDLNTPDTSPSGNIHGMVLATILGRGSERMLEAATACQTEESHVAFVGVREIDAGEQAWIDEGDMTCHLMEHVTRDGLAASLSNAIEIANTAKAGFGLTIDLDALDPKDAPFVATPVDNGISAEELAKVLTSIPHSDRVLGMEVTEFTPRNDHDANDACNLVASLIIAVCD